MGATVESEPRSDLTGESHGYADDWLRNHSVPLSVGLTRQRIGDLLRQVSDVSVLKKTIAHFEKLGFGKFHLVVDRGVRSAENVKALRTAGYVLTIGHLSPLTPVKTALCEV